MLRPLGAPLRLGHSVIRARRSLYTSATRLATDQPPDINYDRTKDKREKRGGLDAVRNATYKEHTEAITSLHDVVTANMFRGNIIEENKYFAGEISHSDMRLFQRNPHIIKQLWPRPSFDVKAMSEFITPDNIAKRKAFRELLSTDLFTPEYNIPIERERELARERLRTICENGFISVRDFDTNPLWIFAAHDLVSCVDGSTATKMTVQFNLFGGTLLSIGTEKHHAILDDIDSFAKVGCFGLSELGYGNNAVKMETLIEYDPASQMFSVDTPHPMAQKYWITNGAIDAHYCLVFGDLRIRGHDDTFGVHGVMVPIRDLETHKPMPGVTIHDMGHKMGVNGIDNAKLAFHGVKVPREALLDRFAQIDADGTYHTEVKGSVRNRFLKTADQLLSGRLCISSMSQGVSKGLLAIAIEYSCSRLSTGPTGESTAPIMAFALQQQALMPLLAKTIACEVALYKVKTAWAMNRKETPICSNSMLIAYCCAIKAYSGWHVSKLANETRERCGGQGYLSANRFGQGITGVHCSITAEGDCSVLMMKVMMEVGNELKSNKSLQKAYLRTYGQYLLAEKFGIQSMVTTLARKKLDSPAGLVELMKKRSQVLVMRSGEAMVKTTPEEKKYMSPTGKVEDDKGYRDRRRRVLYHKTVTHNQHLIQSAANAWTEAFVAETFLDAIQEESDPALVAVLNQLLTLYCLDCIENDVGNFKEICVDIPMTTLDNKYAEFSRLLAPNAIGICDSFGFTPEMMSAPISRDWVKYNAIDNAGEVRDIDY